MFPYTHHFPIWALCPHYFPIILYKWFIWSSYSQLDLSHLPLALPDRGRRGFRLSPGRSPKDSIPSGPPASNVAIGNLLQNVSFNGKMIYEWKLSITVFVWWVESSHGNLMTACDKWWFSIAMINDQRVTHNSGEMMPSSSGMLW